jgi:3-methyladenine DNA glycosylase AlkD
VPTRRHGAPGRRAGSALSRRAWSPEALRRPLGAVARPAPAIDLRTYLRSPLPVLSVPMGALRRLVADRLRVAPPRDEAELLRAVRRLWAGPVFEDRMVAILLLDRYARRLTEVGWRAVDRCVTGATGWALSDTLAAGPVARLVERSPRRWSLVFGWARSPDPWRRRAALYAQARRVRAGTIDGPLRLLHALHADPDPWVQRAVGTWLRACREVDRTRVDRFLWSHAGALAPVTISVATEKAPRRFRRALRRRRTSLRRTADRRAE